MTVNRLRKLAGPNGSGKSTLYQTIKSKVDTGIWINADELLSTFNLKGFIDYASLGFVPTLHSFEKFLRLKKTIRFVEEFDFGQETNQFVFGSYTVAFPSKKMSNQCAAFFADFLRHTLIKGGNTFTTETVFSHSAKLELVRQAKAKQFKTYLYFIATSSPEINISRISTRVNKGGHFVSPDKVRKRYENSIDLLSKHITIFHRVFIFDNSENAITLIASFVQGRLEKVYVQTLPEWVQNILPS